MIVQHLHGEWMAKDISIHHGCQKAAHRCQGCFEDEAVGLLHVSADVRADLGCAIVTTTTTLIISTVVPASVHSVCTPNVLDFQASRQQAGKQSKRASSSCLTVCCRVK